MSHAADALMVLGVAFLACGLLARAGSRFGLPTVPLFMLAGIVLGPHTGGVTLVAQPADLELVARIGLVFLLFYLGLEFSLGDLTSGGRKLALAASTYLVLNVGGGLAYGLLLGWGTAEAFLIAGILGTSSTAMVTKVVLETKRLGSPETRVVLGVTVLEDIFLAFYLALLQPVLGGASDLREALAGIASAFGFLLLLTLVARYGGVAIGKVLGGHGGEETVVVSVGLAITMAGIAEALGVSDAIGAFMVGMIVGASPSAPRLRRLVHPLRDAFAAIFFFHFGLTIAPGAIAGVVPQVVVAVAMTIVLCGVAGVVAARLHGYHRVHAANIGFTVLMRGEFSIILASLALAAGLDRRIADLAAGYVLVLAIVGPLMATATQYTSRLIPRRLFPGGLSGPDEQVPLMLEVGPDALDELGTELVQVRVNPGSGLHGVYVGELRLPEGSTLGLVAREGATQALSPTTQLQHDDVLLFFTGEEQRHAAERRIRAVHREGRLATWRGDTG